MRHLRNADISHYTLFCTRGYWVRSLYLRDLILVMYFFHHSMIHGILAFSCRLPAPARVQDSRVADPNAPRTTENVVEYTTKYLNFRTTPTNYRNPSTRHRTAPSRHRPSVGDGRRAPVEAPRGRVRGPEAPRPRRPARPFLWACSPHLARRRVAANGV